MHPDNIIIVYREDYYIYMWSVKEFIDKKSEVCAWFVHFIWELYSILASSRIIKHVVYYV